MSDTLSETVHEGSGLLEVLESAVGGAISKLRKGTSAAKEILGMPVHLRSPEEILGALDSEDEEPLYI